MSKELLIELFGYLGSFLVLVSFLMTSVVKLRIVNTIGGLIFMTYAFIIKSYPTAIMNLCLVFINLYYLWKMSHTEKTYDFLEVHSNDAFMNYTLNRYKDDINQCFPGIQLDPNEMTRSFVISHEGKPVGLTLGKQVGDDLELVLDYVIPEYRDFSIAPFVFSKLKEAGLHKVIYTGPTPESHMTYLNKVGFTKTENYFEKIL